MLAVIVITKAEAAPLLKELVANVKSFCAQFEGADRRGSPGAATAQCIELINSGVDQNRFLFDRKQASSCLQAFKSHNPLSPCQTVLIGKGTDGTQCESSNDCRIPLICQGAHDSRNGKCSAPLKEGSPCDNESVYASRFFAASKRGPCAQGLHCAIGQHQVCVKD